MKQSSMQRRWNQLVPVSLLAILLVFWSKSGAQLPPAGGAPPPAEDGPQVGQKAPDFTLPDKYGVPMTLSKLLATAAAGKGDEPRRSPWVLLVFYRGYRCSFCQFDLRSLQEHLDEFTARGVRIVAISVDGSDVTRKHAKKKGLTLTFLSDSEAEVIRRYDLLRERSGLRRAEVARPAQFLIDSGGTIRWINLSEDMRVRVRPQDILKVIDELTVASSSPRK
jgi:peroxiredoxin